MEIDAAIRRNRRIRRDMEINIAVGIVAVTVRNSPCAANIGTGWPAARIVILDSDFGIIPEPELDIARADFDRIASRTDLADEQLPEETQSVPTHYKAGIAPRPEHHIDPMIRRHVPRANSRIDRDELRRAVRRGRHCVAVYRPSNAIISWIAGKINRANANGNIALRQRNRRIPLCTVTGAENRRQNERRRLYYCSIASGDDHHDDRIGIDAGDASGRVAAAYIAYRNANLRRACRKNRIVCREPIVETRRSAVERVRRSAGNIELDTIGRKIPDRIREGQANLDMRTRRETPGGMVQRHIDRAVHDNPEFASNIERIVANYNDHLDSGRIDTAGNAANTGRIVKICENISGRIDTGGAIRRCPVHYLRRT